VDRFSLATFAAIRTAIACLLLINATGLVGRAPFPDRALEVTSAGGGRDAVKLCTPVGGMRPPFRRVRGKEAID
jgi:hypothetical protein